MLAQATHTASVALAITGMFGNRGSRFAGRLLTYFPFSFLSVTKIASLVYERKNYAVGNGKGAPLATDNCYIIRMTSGVDEVNLSDSALKQDLLKPRTTY